MTVPTRADRDQVLAFRLSSHNLVRRMPPGSLVEAAGACGVQNTPPGSAMLALCARIDSLTPAEITRALETDKVLLQARSLRAAPYLFPARDAHVFTAGLLPEDEESLRFFILGAGPALDKLGMSATEIVERTSTELLDALDGRMLTFRQLSAELTERIAGQLPAQKLEAWHSPSWYAPNQSLGEAIVHFALYPIALKGLYCYAPPKGNEVWFVRTDQWLGSPLPQVEPDEARAELARRYLRCYGPSTPEGLGDWAGIAPADVGRVWSLIQSNLVEVDFQGRRTWLHERDIASFESPPMPKGVRLLPPHDPYLSQPDRETLLPSRVLHRRVWRSIGNPGVILIDGRLTATWRPQKKGRRLTVFIQPFATLAEEALSEIEAEANLIAPFRGCKAADVAFSD